MRALGVLLVLILLCAMPPARAQETQSDSQVDVQPTTAPNVQSKNASTLDSVIFPAGQSSVELPTKFQIPHIYGASGIAIDAEVAKQLGRAISAPVTVVMAPRVEEAHGIIPEMRIGDLVMHDVSFQTIPWAYDERTDVKTVGLLGIDTDLGTSPTNRDSRRTR